MSHLLDIRCPSCQSKQLTTTEKSSGRLTLTCLACGNVFKATDTDTTPQKIVEQPLKPATSAVGHNPVNAAPDLNALNRQIVEVARSSGKLSAIKYCKDLTGWSLDQCKRHVDGLVDPNIVREWNVADLADSPDSVTGIDQHIIHLARTKGKLHAVKFYSDQTGKGLKESLDYVDKTVPTGTFKKTEGCFIATACYGDYDAEEVIVLRRYRDNVLQQTKSGRFMVQLYYRVSPFLADFIQERKVLKKAVRQYILQPLVRKLSGK